MTVMPKVRKAIVPVAPWEEMQVSGLIAVSESADVDHGLRTFTVKVQSTLVCRPSRPNVAVALRLTDINGIQYLLGTDDAPHPLCAAHIVTGNLASEECRYTFEAESKSPYGLLQIIDNG